jgi:phosphoribosylglycinamide formyltransferase-1
VSSCNIVVLISGKGSNLQAIIDAVESEQIPARISAVISNRPDAKGLIKAAAAGIECTALDNDQFASRDAFDQALMDCIDQYRPDLLVLAGYMRILNDDFIEHYAGRIINIHPSLLPEFRGLHTHQRVLDAGNTKHGASVHFVTKELDGGPVVIQAEVDVSATDDVATLAVRVLEQEHIILPLAIQWIAQGRLHCDNDHAILDDRALTRPVLWKQDALQ